jgi:hypothetical protein
MKKISWHFFNAGNNLQTVVNKYFLAVMQQQQLSLHCLNYYQQYKL